jgi:hypothetical protein
MKKLFLYIPLFMLTISLSLSLAYSQGNLSKYSVSELTSADTTNKSKSDDTTGKKKDEEKEKPFDDVIKDYKVIKGFFTLYQKEDEGKVYLEIKPDQFNKIFLCAITREAADGTYFDAPSMQGSFPFILKRVGKRILFIQKNVEFRANENMPISRAVTRGVTDSIIGSAKIESLPHPERGSILIDPSGFFLQDIDFVGDTFSEHKKDVKYEFDKENSYFSSLQSFPENTEIETMIYFKSGNPKPAMTIPDARSFRHIYHYSLSVIPDSDYKPRVADDRIGYFLTMYQDYSTVQRDTPYTRYINRWQLEKADPNAKLSPPKQQIVYWLENTIPLEYRDAVREGILLWNTAFEKVGFKDVIVVKQQPDNADWSAGDVRYNTIRWMVHPGAAFAVGPSRANPFTGQIYNAQITINADMVRAVFESEQQFVQPLAPGTNSLSSWERAGVRDQKFCDYQFGAGPDAGFGLELLNARGDVDNGKIDVPKYLHDFLVHVVAHEVGHTLGLRHNFKGTSIYPYDKLSDGNLTSSVMDYVPVYIALKGQKQGPYFQTHLGVYDYLAIEYGYKPINSVGDPSGSKELEEIAARTAQPQYQYGSDEDALDDSRAIDPLSNRYDLSDDPILFYKNRVLLVQELWNTMESHFETKGERYYRLRQVFDRSLKQYTIAVQNVSKYIGGIYVHRDHVGDPNGHLPFEPVPAEKQQQALDFFKENIFSAQSFPFKPELLDKLGAERLEDFSDALWETKRIDYPIHDEILKIQSDALNRLYDPLLLNRMHDIEIQSNQKIKVLMMSDLFEQVRDSIWSELLDNSNINSFRRPLQRAHLDILIGLLLKPSDELPEDARTLARADLITLDTRIGQVLATNKIDPETHAHLDESRARIQAALKAGIEQTVNK